MPRQVFDFTKPIRYPTFTASYLSGKRFPKIVSLLHGGEYFIMEGELNTRTIEVYQIESGENTNPPVRTIEIKNESGSVTAIAEMGQFIFVAIENKNLIPEVQVIEFDEPGGDYSTKNVIKEGLPLNAERINSILPIFNGNLLICTHNIGKVSVIDTNTMRAKFCSPFGEDVKFFGVTRV